MISTAARASNRKFCSAPIHVRPDGERFPLVINPDGTPAHYPLCFLLDLRSKNKASSTMETTARDLLHLEQVLAFMEVLNLEERLEQGSYLKPEEVDNIASLCGVSTQSLRRFNDEKVVRIRRGHLFSKADAVTNQVKHRRIP